jgi:prepilin-type processing-associated H-X9-DG protein
VGNPKVFKCPSDRKEIFEQTASSYAWNFLLNGKRWDDFAILGVRFESHVVPVFMDKEGFHAARGPGKEVNYLYADGHVKNFLAIEGTGGASP